MHDIEGSRRVKVYTEGGARRRSREVMGKATLHRGK